MKEEQENFIIPKKVLIGTLNLILESNNTLPIKVTYDVIAALQKLEKLSTMEKVEKENLKE